MFLSRTASAIVLAHVLSTGPVKADTIATYLDAAGAPSAVLELADDGSARMGSPGDKQPYRLLQGGTVYHVWPTQSGWQVLRAEDLDAAMSTRKPQPAPDARGPQIALKEVGPGAAGRFRGVRYAMTFDGESSPISWVLSRDRALAPIGQADRRFRAQANATLMIMGGLPKADLSAVYSILESATVVKDADTTLGSVVERTDDSARFQLPSAPLTSSEVLAKFGTR